MIIKWEGAEAKQVALRISTQDFLDLGIPESAIAKGEFRGKLKTYGPWALPVSYKALAMSVVYVPEERKRYSAEHDSVVAFGMRTLSGVSQGGHELEGYVSIGGRKYSAFTSSQLFEVDGRLVDVATIHVRMR